MSKHNQRTEYGKTLVELGEKDDRIVVLEADLGKSTMTCLFEERFPDRHFEMGISESNMTGFAAGLALTGKIAFTNSFAVFASGRSYDQIRQSIGTAHLNVKIVGSSTGLSDFGDGATHQAIEDMAIMSAIPGMTVLSPCDGIEIKKAVRAAVELDGPVYIRSCRNDVPDIYPEDAEYKMGSPVVFREGGDIVIFTTGIMVHEALKAAETLASENIDASVVHLPGIKPLDEDAIKALAKGKKGIVVCEEHTIYGGLNMVISYMFNGSGIPIESVAIMDQFGQSAMSHEELLVQYKLDATSIAEKARKLMK